MSVMAELMVVMVGQSLSKHWPLKVRELCGLSPWFSNFHILSKKSCRSWHFSGNDKKHLIRKDSGSSDLDLP